MNAREPNVADIVRYTTVIPAHGPDTYDITAGILQGVVNLGVRVRLVDGPPVTMEVSEIDGNVLCGTVIDENGDYLPDPHQIEAIWSVGYEFDEIDRVEVL